MCIITPDCKYNEIVHNFSFMVKTIGEGRAKDLDLVFIEILAKDVDSLKEHNFDLKRIQMLHRCLGVFASRIYDATGVVLLGSNPAPLQAVTQEGLRLLDAVCRVRELPKDGHCLFRGVALGVLEYLRDADEFDKALFISKLDRVILALGSYDPKLKPLYEQALTVAYAVVQRKLTVDDAIDPKQTSDLFVEFLRHLAASYNFSSNNEVLVALLANDGKQKYFNDMCDMKKATFGDEPEVVALQSTLNLDIRVVDTVVVGKGEKRAESYFLNRTPETVFLLFTHTHLHYNVAYPR